MKRKTKAQIYRDYKYNIKMFAWNTLYILERQRSHETQSRGPWIEFILLTNTVVTSAIKIVISIQVSQPQCRMSTPLYDQGCKWHYKKFSENAGVQGPHRPWWGQGAKPLWGAQGGKAPWEKLNFQLKNWPLLDRSWLKSEG